MVPCVLTFQSGDGLALGGSRLDAPKNRRYKLVRASFDIVLCKSRHEDVCISIHALGAALGAAALAIDNLLDTRVEFHLPSVGGDVGIVAIENVLDGVGTPSGTIAKIVFIIVPTPAGTAGCGA
jgi:hypothetical protein